jgi:hypothetical protein
MFVINMIMLIAGVDYSMTCPSICVFNGNLGEFSFKKCKFYYLTDKKKYANQFHTNIKGENFQYYEGDYMRFDSISQWAMKYLVGMEQICLEGYAFGAKGKVFHIAENTGVLKYKIFQTQIPLEIVQPSAVKKLATGKGNATKDEMHTSFHLETGLDLIFTITPDRKDAISPITDIVDSYYICKYLYEKIKDLS